MRSERQMLARRCTALLMSLLLVTASGRSLAIAAEGEAAEEVVAAEQIAPEEEAAVAETVEPELGAESGPAAEPEAVPDEQAVATEEPAAEVDAAASEEPAAGEDELAAGDESAESAESEPQNEPEAEEVEVEPEANEPGPQMASGSFSFADSGIRISRLSSGDVTYDEATQTLTLDNANMYRLTVNTSVTIVLVGGSSVEYFDSSGQGISLTIEGEGKLFLTEDSLDVGYYDDEEHGSQYTGNVIIKSGTLVFPHDDYDSGYSYGVRCADCTIVDGTIYGYVRCQGFSIAGGTVTGRVSCQSDVTIASDDVSIGGLSAKSLTMSAGTINGYVGCSGDFRMSGGRVTGSDDDYLVSCGSFEMLDGTVENLYEVSYYEDGEQRYRYKTAVKVTDSAEVSGGTVRGSIEGKYKYDEDGRYVYDDDGNPVFTGSPSASIAGGTVDGSVSCQDFSITGGTVTSHVSCQSDVTIASDGVSIGGLSAKSLTMSTGTIDGCVTCSGDFRMSGGRVTGSSYDQLVSCRSFEMLDGTVENLYRSSDYEDGEQRYRYTAVRVTDSAEVSGGTVRGSIEGCYKTDEYGDYVYDDDGNRIRTGSVTIAGGTVDGSVSCQDFSITGGTVTSHVSCQSDVTITRETISIGGFTGKSLSVTAGKVTGYVSCEGDVTIASDGVSLSSLDAKSLTMSKGAIKGVINCSGAVKITGGTIAAVDPNPDSWYDKTGIRAGSFSMTGGRVKLTDYKTGISASGNVSATGGSLTITRVNRSSNEIDGISSGGTVKITNTASIKGGISAKTVTFSKGVLAGGIGATTVTVTGGTVNGGIEGSYVRDKDGNYTYDSNGNYIRTGTITISGGTVKGGLNTKTVKISKGTVTGGINALSVTVSGGAVSGGIDGGSTRDKNNNNIPQGTVILSGGTTKGRIYCKSLSVRKGATLSITGTNEYGSPIVCATLSMSGGKITFAKYREGISASKSVTITGGAISSTGIKDHWRGAIDTVTFTMKGGAISTPKWRQAVSAKTVTMTKGTITGHVSASGSMKLAGGTISYTGTGANDGTSVVNATTLAMAGGTIKAAKCGSAVNVSKAFTITKGAISAVNCDNGITAQQYADAKTAAITIKGGTIVVTKPSRVGINVYYGNFTMTGGKVKITGAYEYGLRAEGTTYRGKKYGGRIKITGGKLISTVRIVNKSYGAISASYGMSNKTSCLVKVLGRVPVGTKIKVGGNTFEVCDYNYARLVQYGSSKTTASFGKIKLAGVVYEVRGVGANAFNTSQGKKVTSLNFANSLNYVGANAFKGTAALTALRLRLDVNEQWIPRGNSYSTKVTTSHNAKYSKTAFAGAGKNGGQGLTVKISYSDEGISGYKIYLMGLGLPSAAKVGRYS